MTITKLIQRIAVTLTGLIVLLIIAAVIFIQRFDTNHYKPRLSTYIYEHTGRQIHFNGDIKLSLWPWLNLKIDQVILDNPPGFPKQPFIQIQRGQVSLELLPLIFRREIQLGTIKFEQANIHLVTNSAGKNNWEGFQQGAQNQSQSSKSSGTPSKTDISISDIDISNSQLLWDNLKTEQSMSLDSFFLQSDSINFNKPFTLSTRFQFLQNQSLVLDNVNLKAHLNIDPAQQYYKIESIDFSAAYTQNQKKSIPIDVNTSASLKLKEQKIEVPMFTAKIDEHPISGKFSLNNFSKPTVRFLLVGDTLNIDQYLSTSDQTTTQTNGNTSPQKPSSTPYDPDYDLQLNKTLRNFDIEGSLQLDLLRHKNVTMNRVYIPITVKKGIANLTPITAELYQGTVEISAKIDATANTPLLQIEQKITGVQVGQLFRDLVHKDLMSGQGYFQSTVTAKSYQIPRLLQTLNGSTSFSIKNGQLKNVDFLELLQLADTISKAGKNISQSTSDRPTPFAELTGSLSINNGIGTNKDLHLQSPLLEIKGHGTLNFITLWINYNLEGHMANNSFMVPILVQGPLSNPAYSLDVPTLLAHQLKNHIGSIAETVLTTGEAAGGAVAPVQNLLKQQLENLLSQ